MESVISGISCRLSFFNLLKCLCIVAIWLNSGASGKESPGRDRNTKPYRLVCYFGSWAGYRLGDGEISPGDLDAHACTHLIYAFAKLQDDKITPGDANLDLEDNYGKGFYNKFNALRSRNSELTTLISIGGWNEGSELLNYKYSFMSRSPARRKVFVNSVVEFLKKYDFDGLDFAWQYPALREGVLRPEDRETYVMVLKELKEAFEPYGFLLTAAVSAGKDTIDAAYDIPLVSMYLDIINIMTYDFHGAFDSYTGHNAPMYARVNQSDEDKYKNLDYAVRYWISEGADRQKITLGIPLYGRCHTLKDSNKMGYGALSAGDGTMGPLTKQPGMQGYNELCMHMKKERWNTVWNECHLAPYMYRGDQWCSYDDEISVKIKVQYAKAMRLGGAMIWSVDTDDFHGFCTGKKNPLLMAIVDELEDTSPAQLPTVIVDRCVSQSTDRQDTTAGPTTTTRTTTTTTATPPTRNPWIPADFSCGLWGHFPIPGVCEKFIKCIPNGMDYIAVVMDCPGNTVYNPDNRNCDYRSNVPGCQ